MKFPNFQGSALPFPYAWASIMLTLVPTGVALILQGVAGVEVSPTLDRYISLAAIVIGLVLSVGAVLVLLAQFKPNMTPKKRFLIEFQGTVCVASAWSAVLVLLTIALPDTAFVMLGFSGTALGGWARVVMMIVDKRRTARRMKNDVSISSS